MRIEWILFDWGGTLCDVSRQPEALLAGARQVVRLLKGESDPTCTGELVAEALKAEKRAAADLQGREVDLGKLLADWAAARGWVVTDNQIEQAVEAVGMEWSDGALQPMPGALDALRQLRLRGYRLGLVSNVWIPPRFCRRELARQQMLEFLDVTVFSSEVGFRKPSPVIYEAAFSTVFPDARPEDLSCVLFVGDSPVCDVIAPARFGLKTALVDGVPGMWPEADYAAAQPDFRLKTVADLLGVLQNERSADPPPVDTGNRLGVESQPDLD